MLSKSTDPRGEWGAVVLTLPVRLIPFPSGTNTYRRGVGMTGNGSISSPPPKTAYEACSDVGKQREKHKEKIREYLAGSIPTLRTPLGNIHTAITLQRDL